MRRPTRYLMLVGTAAALACGGGESLTGPTTGSLEVASTTSGVELDPDGYTVRVDAEPARGIGLAGTIPSTEVAPGTHTVELGGVANNCIVAGDNPRTVIVARGDTATVAFEVACNPTTGSLTIMTATTGSALDPDGYSVTIDGSDRTTLGTNTGVTLDRLAPGRHSVGLGALDAICQVESENPQPVMVIAGATVTAAFDVSCLKPLPEVPPGGPELPLPMPPSRGPVFFVATTGSDTNPGTLRAPWRSIQKAMDNLQPDQVAYVRAGTYETGGPFGTSADTYTWTTTCSATAPCSIVAYPGQRPVLHGQIRIEGSGLRLSGFIMEGPLSADVASCSARRANQVDLVGASYVELSHNEIRQNDYHAGISLIGVGHVQIMDNWIHRNGRFGITTDPCTGNQVFETDHGIYWSTTDGQGGNLVAGNLIDHNRAKGVQFFDGPITDGVTVVNNTIVDNGDAGLLINGSVSNIQVVDNVVAFNGQAGAHPQIRVQAGIGHVVTRNLTYHPVAAYAGIEGTTGVSDNDVADPRFVDRSSGDYHVATGSPAIDQALTAWALATDLDGVRRPVGANPDLGAYER